MECPSGPSVLITDEQWEFVWQKLRFYVHRRYRWFYRQTGRDLDGIVSKAILDTMEGRRRYPPIDKETGMEKPDVTLFVFLCCVVDSLIRTHLSTATRLCELDDTLQVGEVHRPRRSFLFKQTNLEDTASYNELVAEMRELVRGDPLLDRMVEWWAIEPDLKPRELAEALGVDKSQIQNALKRLRRRLARLRKEWQ
jgi:DNA-directed RNA polymerase specialized sigma24 family protein